MPAQITATDPAAQVLGGAPTCSFALNSPDEIAAVASERRSEGAQVLVFAFRRSTAEFIAHHLRSAAALRVGIPTRTAENGTLERFGGHELDVLVTTLAEGFRCPVTCRTVLHAELPPYGGSFSAEMCQREARVDRLDAPRHVPARSRFDGEWHQHKGPPPGGPFFAPPKPGSPRLGLPAVATNAPVALEPWQGSSFPL